MRNKQCTCKKYNKNNTIIDLSKREGVLRKEMLHNKRCARKNMALHLLCNTFLNEND